LGRLEFSCRQGTVRRPEEGADEDPHQEVPGHDLLRREQVHGAIDLGYDGRGKRQRIKRKGRTKEAVKDKLIKAVDELELGIDTSDGYTVENAVRDWLAKGAKGLGEGTTDGYRILAENNLIPLIGAYKLKKLTADNVDDWLDGLTDKLSIRSCAAPSGRRRRETRSSATWPTR
jgi:hypothetical protein